MAMQSKTVHSVDTKPTKTAAAVHTTLTLDWTGVTEAQLQALAARQITVLVQAKFRADATAEKPADRKPIPAQYTVKVAEIGARGVVEAVTVDSTKARAAALSAEERKRLIAELQQMDKAPAK